MRKIIVITILNSLFYIVNGQTIKTYRTNTELFLALNCITNKIEVDTLFYIKRKITLYYTNTEITKLKILDDENGDEIIYDVLDDQIDKPFTRHDLLVVSENATNTQGGMCPECSKKGDKTHIYFSPESGGSITYEQAYGSEDPSRNVIMSIEYFNKIANKK